MPPSIRGRWGEPDEMRDQRQVAAPERPLDVDVGPVERADRPRAARRRAASSSGAERERRRRRGAEVVGGHRSGEGHHSAARERRQLEGGEVAVPHPALAAARPAPRSRCGRAGATSRSRRAARARARRAGSRAMRHSAASRSSSVPAKRCQRAAQPGSTCTRWPRRLEARDRAVERRRVGGEARRRVDADATQLRLARPRLRRSPPRAAPRPLAPRRTRPAARRSSPAATPAGHLAWWLSRGSAKRSTTEPQAPVLGSRAPNTSRAMRACMIAPAHIAQGSSVT